MAEDKVTNLYNAFVKNGYAMEPEAQFRENLKDPKKRKAAYDALVADGYNMEPFADFESNIGFGAPAPAATSASELQAQSTVAPATATTPDAEPEQVPVQSEPGQPAWEPSEQEKIRMSYQMHTMLNDFKQKSKARIEQIQRITEPFTPEGRQKRRAMEFHAQLAGTPTKVMGLTPPTPAPAYDAEPGEATERAAQQQSVQSGQSPVPYGVKYIDGKAVTQWLLPDGRLTTNYLEADKAEYGARTVRLRNQFIDRMKQNGLDPAKPEDVEMQAQFDAQAPAYGVVADLWREAEEKHKADRSRNADRHWDRYAAMGGGPEMRIVTASMNRHDDNISHMTRFDLQKMMDNAWARVGSQVTANCYNRLRTQYPQATEEELQKAATDMARGLTDNAVYQYAVKQNTPKSTLEYFGRTVADMNVINSISKGLARSPAGTSGDLPAYEAAMGEYGKNHRVAQVAGTVAGMAVDPVTWVSGGVGSVAGKGAISLGGRYVANRAATSISAQVGSRLFSSSLTGRIITVAAAGGGNFATYEMLKEGESQYLHGGHVNAETGEVEGYSAGAILKAGGHGLVLGSVTGTLAPMIGNVADKYAKATTSTAGKAGVRFGEVAVSTVADGTVFSIPQWISGEGDAFDVWTDNMAMMLGFKAQHGIKSAPRMIASLRPVKPTNGRPLTQAERNHNRMDFEERLRRNMDASPGDLSFTADEREELRRTGYGELADLFSRDRVQEAQNPNINPAEGSIELRAERVEAETIHRSPEFDGYSAMEELMQDSRVSQAARAKAYYILTGRMLPMGSVTGYTKTTADDGRVTINSTTADGEIVTSRTFKNEQEAKQETDNIMRQAELNTIDVGERYKEAVADDMVLDAAISEVSPGADPATIKKIYVAVKAGNKDVTESQVQLVEFIDEAIGRNKEIADKYRPEAIRAELMNETGIDVDAVLRKMPGKRTEAEQAAVKSYLERLFPEKARQQNAEPTPEQAEAQNRYEQGRLLYGRFEEGDPTVQADVDAIALRMQEAYQAVEDAFGAEAEYYMFHVNENPWALVNDPELTAEQQDAVLYYINAKAALDGVMDASNEAADRKRAEVEQSVGKRTHKDNGIIIPATMKVDDRQVYVVKGDVVMFPDGSAVDVRNSSESIVVMDAQTGEYEFTSPDQIFKVSEAVNPQDELDTALSVIEQEQMSVFGQNAIAPEEPAEGEAPIDQSADVSREPAPETASTEEYDRGYEQGLKEAAKADDAWIANLIKIYSQNTPESMPETMKGRLDAFLYEQQRRAQAVPKTENSVDNAQQTADDGFIPIDPELINSRTDENGNIIWDELQQEQSRSEEHKQSALSRVPLNEKGKPDFGAVDADTAWDAIVEKTSNEAMAQSFADNMVAASEAELKKAEKVKTKPTTDLDEFIAADNERIANIDRAKTALDHWKKVAGTKQRRQAEADAVRDSQRSSDMEQTEEVSYKLSDEVDENGRQFVLTSNGRLEFGTINNVEGLESAPILLSEGIITNKATHDGYGLVHIEARHGAQIRGLGYNSVLEFIETVARDYHTIRKGIVREGRQTYMLQLTDAHNNTLMVELARDGSYYTINTAGAFKMSYGRNREIVYDRHTTVKQPVEVAEESQKPTQGDTSDNSRMNSSAQSGDKDRDSASKKQTDGAESSLRGTPQNGTGDLSDGIVPAMPITAEDLAKLGERDRREVEDYLSRRWSCDVGVIGDVRDIESLPADSRADIIDAYEDGETGAIYSRGDKKIYIFAGKNGDESLSGVLLHENVHAVVDMLGDDCREFLEAFMGQLKDLPYHRGAFGRLYKMVHEAYPEDRASDEFLAYVLQECLRTPLLAEFLNESLDGSTLYYLNNKILNKLYESTEEYPGRVAEGKAVQDNSRAQHARVQETVVDTEGGLQGGERRERRELGEGQTVGERYEPAGRTDKGEAVHDNSRVQWSRVQEDNGSREREPHEISGGASGERRESGWESEAGGQPVGERYESTEEYPGRVAEGKAVQDNSRAQHARVQETVVDTEGGFQGGERRELGEGGERRERGDEGIAEEAEIASEEDALNSRIEVKDDDWTEGGGYTPTLKRTIVIDGIHNVTQVDAPNDKGDYTGSIFEYDGKAFGDLREVISYIDSSQPATIGERIAEAEAEVNTTPTDGQKKAGNYKKGHVQVGTFDVTIENPKGSKRSGTDADGKKWETTMTHTYGYILGTKGVDGDHIDVYISSDIDGWNGRKVFVVDQYNPDGSFDEHKVMLGFNDKDEAFEAYLSNYEAGWEKGRRLDVTAANLDDFEKWIESSKRKTKAFTEYAGVKVICPVCGKAGIPNYHSHDVVCPQCNSDLSVFRQIDQLSENEKQELSDKFVGEDNQGNPIDHVGNLIVEDVMSIDDISDDDFINPARTVGLPKLPGVVSDAIGSNDKRVIIKRNIFGKNHKNHKELTPAESREILRTALYTPSLYGQNQKQTRPCNWILIHLADKNTCVLLEVDNTKENCEIVNWHYLREETLKQKERQAEREGGRILTLSEGNVAGNTSRGLSSDGKVNTFFSDKQVSAEEKRPAVDESADKQMDGAGSSELYTITPTSYTNKKGKTSDVHLVKFNRELTAEEKAALDTFVRGQLTEGKKTPRGWYDRKQGGYMMRSEEAARQLGEMLGNKEAVADAQPLSREDIKAAVKPAEKPARKKPTPKPANTATIDEVAQGEPTEQKKVDYKVGDVVELTTGDRFVIRHIRPDGTMHGRYVQSKLHGNDVSGMRPEKIKRVLETSEDMPTDTPAPAEPKSEPAPKGQFKVTDEMKAQEDELRKLLGIDDDEGSTDSYFRDPDELTPAQKRKVFSLGVDYAFNFLDNGVTSFPDFAKAVVGRLGSKVKPFIKSWYEGAKRVPGYGGEGYTDTAEVDRFDIENFDKPSPDAIRDAEMRVAERKAKEAAEQAERELIAERNEQRKKDEQQTATNTAALAEKAEAVASEAEKHASLADGRKPERKTILRDLKRIDDTLDEINDQLALLGYYEADLDSPEHEVYGLRRSAEKKAVKDAVKLAKQLVDDLGIELDKVTGKTTEQMQKSRGKNDTAVRANIAQVGGDITVNLPYPDGRNLHISIGLSPTHERGVEPNRGGGAWEGDNYEVDRIMFRFGNSHNHFLPTDVTYGKMLDEIQRAAKWGQPKKQEVPKAEPQEEAYHGTVTLKDGREAVVIVANHTETMGEPARLTDYIVGVKGEPGTIKISPEEIAHTGAPTAEDIPSHAKEEESHNGYKRGDEVMWDRYGNGKWEKVKIEDFDADGSPIFESVKGIMSEKGDWSRVKPADGVFGEAKRVATKAQEEKKRSSRKKDVTLKPEQPVGDLFGGLFDNTQNLSNHEETEMGTRPGEAGGQRQQLKQDTQVGGDEPRRETERPAGEAGSGSTGMDSDADRAGGRGLHDVATQPALDHLPEKERKNVHNNHVERGTEVAPKSESARIKANIAAIETMKKLEASGEAPTAADMKKLRAFSGWGGLGKAFSDWDTSRQLRQLLGDKLYDEGAEMSRNSAYFTPVYIVDAMWDIARAMGFKGGRVLEGSAGIGNVLGLMPQDLSERSYIRAVEKDPTTGKMLSLLYPDAVVDIDGFEKVKIETGTYDLVITNVPFVPGLKVADTSGDGDISKEFKTSIHDFCIAKNVRKLRDGGVGVFITTAGSMDGTGRLHKWLSNRENADIVGMFRMHNETFGGTNATSDIIVVRKRVNGVKSPNAIDCSLTTGVRTAEYDTGERKKVKNVGEVPIIKTLSMSYNRYYVDHPEYMAGEMHFGFEKGDTSFRPESKGLYPIKEKDQSQLLSQWVEDMKQKLADTSEEAAPTVMNHRDEYVPTYDKVGNEVKTGTVVVDSQGRICVNYDGTARPLMSKLDNKNPKSANERIAQFNKNKVKGRSRVQVVQDYNAIKKALNDLLEYQKTSDSDEGLQPKLKALNRAFDSFVATYGHLHGNNGLAWLKNDVDYPSVIALETYREEGLEHKKVFGKADIFSRRVVVRPEQPKATNVRDGVTLSIRQTGSLDTRYIAEQLGMSEADVRREVIEAGLGYENPLTHSMEAAHEYLSGNVREKMQQAEVNNEDGRYTPNITALRKVVPHNIPSHFIEFSIGSSWLRPELFEQYVKERTGAKVKLTYAGGMWAMDKPKWTGEQDKSFGIRSEICDKIITGTELIDAAMTNRTIRVSKQQKDGPTISDPKATSACAAKVDEIRDDFKSWLRSRMESAPELAKEIEETYNNIFNNSAPMTIPDEYIPEYFDGAARVIGGKHIKMREHQAKAVVRGTMQSLMLAHEVGTGKTFTLITTAMEMRRLGTAKKPMIVVQNATLGQFVASAKALYPDARILSLEDKDRNAEGRKDFYAKIRYNDWDMVVIPQSVLERIPDHPDRERRFIEESIQEKMDVIEAMSKDREAGRAVAALKKDVENLRDQLNKLSDIETAEGEVTERVMVTSGSKPKKDGKRAAIAKENAKTRAEEMLNRATDDTLNFDDLGVDAILVDEAHEYKHLGFATAMQRGVKGVDPSYSKKCQGLYLKVKAVQEKSGGRNVIFATGTPISNTAAEVWTFMRYLLPREVMEGHNIWHFDDFVRNFGSIQQMLEFTTQGTYKENNRFAGYSNLPELARIWAGITDTVLTTEAGEVKSQIPELEGGQPTDLYLPQTNGLRAVLKFVRAQLKAYDEMSGQEKKENSHIPLVMYGIAKAAAIDARLVMANAPDDPHSKTNEAVRQTLRSLEDSKAYNGTVAIFADNYQRKNKGTGAVDFNLFYDIRTKLIAQGVPAEHVVIMRDGTTDKAKEKIFAKVNAGEIRVILGTTQRLGVGVNIQERLHTLMHIDAPNRPMDYWQRMGRLLRQGNMHKEMGIPVRVIRFGVEDSLDVTAYQRLKTKGAIADAIMHSKDLLANNLENRILEEEGDEFGNITAELSGSQYAMLQNQTEKELRKLQAKQDQHRQHQMYIHRAEPRLREQIEKFGNDIMRSDEILALLENNPTTITINGKTYHSREDMQKVFEAHNKAMAAKKQSVQQDEPITSTLTFDIGNVHFTLTTHVSQIAWYGGQGALSFDVNVQHDVVSHDIDYKRSFGDIPLKRIINELVDSVTSGKEERSNREAWVNAKERKETDLAALLKDKGKPFEHGERIKVLEQKLEEYTIAMQEELREKEAKYAEMDANIEDATDITFTSEDGEDSEDENVEAKFRDGGEMSDGERLRAIRALEPVAVERNNLSREELFAEYRTLPDVAKDGINIQFLRTAFGKNYKEGGLFAQVVPQLDALLEGSVLAYSEKDSLGGTQRPDGTEHKAHPNVMSFDNYVHKALIADKEYYVRMTVQKTRDNTTGLHSCFVSNVDVYEKPATDETDSAILRRPNAFYDGIVDAKLQQFFERASSEALELDKADRVRELSEKINVPVRIVTEQSDIENLPSARHCRAKGWFDTATGEVVIIVPNNRNVADVDNTFVHEVAGHKGLRAFIGEERFDEFLGEVYNHASNPIRKVIDKKTDDMVNAEADRLRVRKAQARERAGEDVNSSYYADMAEARVEAEAKREEFRKEAIEEYMSDLGGRIGSEGFEKMSRDELTLWGKIKAKVQSFFDKFLRGLKIAKSIRLNDKDLSYILYKSWKNLRDKQGKGGVFADAEDAVMRRRTGFGDPELRPMTKAEKKATRAEATADRIEELFNKAVNGDLTGKPVEIGRLTPEGKAYLEQLSGMRQKDNVSFVLNPSDLVHIHHRHFGDNEKDGRNIPLTIDDIRQVAEIIAAPDRVMFGKEKGGNERNMFFFLKDAGDGSYNLMEIYSDKKGNLTAKSFFKSKEAVSQRAMLLKESSTLTSVTDGASLSDGAKLPKFFEYPTSDREEELRFRDGDLGLEEYISKMKVDAMQANAGNLQAKRDAMRAIGGNLNHLRQAMARQREYDITTAKSVKDLARILMENGLLDTLGNAEVKSLLAQVSNSIGRQDISKQVDRVFEIMVNNHLRNIEQTFGKLISMRTSRADGRGINVQGALDPDGEAILKIFNTWKSLPAETYDAQGNLTPGCILSRMHSAIDAMSDPYAPIAERATLEYTGLQIARDYAESIAKSKQEEKIMREEIKKAKEEKDAGRMTADAYRQFEEATRVSIQQMKLDRIAAYESLMMKLGGELRESVDRAKAWREAEKERVNSIHHLANSDMQGRELRGDREDTRLMKLRNHWLVNWLLEPMSTLDQMLKMFGSKNPNGEGYMQNHFMRGWIDAADKEQEMKESVHKQMDEKAAEIFGKCRVWYNGGSKKVDYTYSDLYDYAKGLPGATITYYDGAEMREYEIGQGELLYLYAVEKMPMGRATNRRMGIDDATIENITNALDPKLKEYADWVQDTLLPQMGDIANEVHKRMFGADMDAIENYFPFVRDKDALKRDVENGQVTQTNDRISVQTGAIKKRVASVAKWNMRKCNFMDVLAKHVDEMTHWTAFAELNRDFGTLLSYNRLKQQVFAMNSVYGSGEQLWKRFQECCAIATDAYEPQRAKFDRFMVQGAKGVTMGKISLRTFTALKQTLSLPAFFGEVNMGYVAADLGTGGVKACQWAWKNMPNFRKRILSRTSGDYRLKENEYDGKIMKASSYGMLPNIGVDAWTIAVGSHGVYKTRKAKYLRWGMEESQAERRAMQDAELCYNKSQQSSEGPFMAPVQVDHTFYATSAMLFRNSSTSYTREAHTSARNLKRLISGEVNEEYVAKQILRTLHPEAEGAWTDAEWANARKNAKREIRSAYVKNTVNLAMFGWILPWLWRIGGVAPILLLSGDDDEKQKQWEDATRQSMFAPVEGLAYGDVIADGLNMLTGANEKSIYMLGRSNPIFSDIMQAAKKADKDMMAAANDVINIIGGMAFGVNPQTITDWTAAIIDYNSDAQTQKECALLVARLLSCPPSQLEKVYFEELDLTAKEASEMTPQEVAERYAEYKMMREAPLTGWLRSEAETDSIKANRKKKVFDLAKERINNNVATERTKQLLSEYDEVTKRQTKINKLRKTDREAFRAGRKELLESVDMRTHGRVKRYKRDMQKLTERYLTAKTPAERDSIVGLMFGTRDRLLEDLDNTQQ